MHRPSTHPTALLAAALVAGAVACSSGSDTTAPQASPSAATTAQISADVAADVAAATGDLSDTYAGSEAASGTLASVGVASPGLLFGASAAATSCTGPDASGFFTCTKTQENGFDMTRAWRYWSGGKFALKYSEATTDSVNHRWTLSGTKASSDTANGGTARTVQASRADTATMTVVRGTAPQHVWNGVGVRNDTTTAKDKNGTRRYVVASSDTTRAVAYAVPRKADAYPLSGSRVHNVRTVWTGANGASTTTTRRAVVTFNGTQTATLVVGALTCDLDLKTRKASNCR